MHESRLVLDRPLVAAPVVCVAASVLIFFVAGFHPGAADKTNTAIGCAALAYGTWAFITHGGGRITALGLFNYAFALFVGVGGINAGLTPDKTISAGYVTAAVTLALAVQILVNLAAWRRASPSSDAPPTSTDLGTAKTVTYLGGAGILLLLAAQKQGLPYGDSALADGAAFACVALFAAGLIFREDTKLASGRVLSAAAGFGLYVTAFHQGAGRLRLVALACVIGLLLTARFPRRWFKWATVAATPVALWWLAQDRLQLQESLHPGGSTGNTGLESMMSAIPVFAKSIQAFLGPVAPLGPTWGSSFLSIPFALVPKSMHPTWVPQALGYELVALVAPARVGSGYSVVSTVYGEWWWNFGLVGLILAVPALAWLVSAVDARFRRAAAALMVRPMALINLVFWAMLAGGIADLVWSGTHTWVVRHLTRLPMLLIVAVILWWAQRSKGSTSASRRRKPHRPSAVRAAE